MFKRDDRNMFDGNFWIRIIRDLQYKSRDITHVCQARTTKILLKNKIYLQCVGFQFDLKFIMKKNYTNS